MSSPSPPGPEPKNIVIEYRLDGKVLVNGEPLPVGKSVEDRLVELGYAWTEPPKAPPPDPDPEMVAGIGPMPVVT